MKKTSAKQVMTYVLLLGLLVLIAVYFLVYKAYNDKADAIESSNATLQQRVNELKEYYDRMESYQAEIDLMRAQVNQMLDTFPSDVKEEDIIVLALETERKAEVAYTNLNINNREAIKTIPAATVQTAGMENLNQDLVFVNRHCSYVNTTTYQELKKCITAINEYSDRLSIDNIVYSRNEDNGLLAGTIDVSFYSVLGTGKAYVPQDLPEYTSGLYELFGVYVPEDTEGTEDVAQ